MITCIADQLRRDEAIRQFAYDDSDGLTLLKGATLRGNLTIGVGRNLNAEGVSPDEITLMLNNDIIAVNDSLESTFPWTTTLDPVRFGVLQNMCFNLGIEGISEFINMLAQVQSGDYAAAAQDMLQSKWAEQVGARAQRLSVQMEKGEWQ
jgi:lysozyme